VRPEALFGRTAGEELVDQSEDTGFVVMTMVPVLKVFDRYDIERFVLECDFEIGYTAVRLVQTAAWRGRTFPLDKRSFRIELQDGQFFQQGFDLDRNPIYYFRNMCRGPWRGGEDVLISSILYRFDRSMAEFCKVNPHTKATLIVLMGLPKDGTSKDPKNDGEDETSKDEGTNVEGSIIPQIETSSSDIGNPRISVDEPWKCHSNKEMMDKLFDILRQHYPGRFSKAFVVKGRGKNTYYSTNLEGKMKLKSIIDSQNIRDRIKFVNKTSELTKYVAIEQLSTIVGGKAPIDDSVYQL
jgi:hypothetical protein